MYKKVLVPVDLADTDLAKPAIATAIEMVRTSGGSVRLINVLAMTPVMLAEYVPPDFDVQRMSAALMPRAFPRLCARAAFTTRCSRKRRRSTRT
jgi:nucleotide-binding universal stress UspA family protein